MCKFFSFVTEPDGHPNERFYFDWVYRKKNLAKDDADSHDHIINHFKLAEEKCNGYEYNPLTGSFEIDNIRNEVNDSIQAEKWVRKVDFKTIVEPLIIKPIINPLKLKAVRKPTQEQIELLKDWQSVGQSVGQSVWESVGQSVWQSVWESVRQSVSQSVWESVAQSVGQSVWESVGQSVWQSVWESVGESVGAYISAFVDTKYKFDFSSSNKLWESGLVPSFDGTTWRLHSGEKAKIIYEITQKELRSK